MVACAARGDAGAQLASFPLANIDLLKDNEGSHFSFVGGGGFHQAKITGLGTCVRKPLVATVAADKTLRVWNYSTKTCEQVKLFTDEPYSASLHPNGHHVLVGFADRLGYFHLLLDDVKLVVDLPVKACRECRFSRGGQLFAAASGPNIHLYNGNTFEALGIFKGHSGAVRSLFWLPEDAGLVSGGLDGAVYEWRLDG